MSNNNNDNNQEDASNEGGKTNRGRGLLAEMLGFFTDTESDDESLETTQSLDWLFESDEDIVIKRDQRKRLPLFHSQPRSFEGKIIVDVEAASSSSSGTPKNNWQNNTSKHASTKTSKNNNQNHSRNVKFGKTQKSKYKLRLRSSATKVNTSTVIRPNISGAASIAPCPLFKRNCVEATAVYRSQIRKQEMELNKLRSGNRKIQEALGKLQKDMLEVIGALGEKLKLQNIAE